MTQNEYRAHMDRIDAMMREKGIFTDRATGKPYFSGYSYTTLYDWDQYFESIVQLYLGWDTRYIRNGVTIFLDSQEENGHIARSSQGDAAQLSEHVKPFLAQISLLCWRKDGNLDFLTEAYYLRMKRYLLYWLTQRADAARGLAFWDSAPHTGMDNQHMRAGWWYDCFCEGVDLNCYLIRECRAFARIAELTTHPEDVSDFEAHAERLKQAIQTYMWDETDGYFYDIDRRTGEKMRVKSIGCFAVLWAHAASTEQAKRLVAEHLQNEREFLRPLPFPALSADSEGYSEQNLPGDLGCCWRANTWVPSDYFVFHGLLDYGYAAFAKHTAETLLENVLAIGDREWYNAESRTGSGQDPFWGWSLLAYFMPREAELGFDPTSIPDVVENPGIPVLR